MVIIVANSGLFLHSSKDGATLECICPSASAWWQYVQYSHSCLLSLGAGGLKQNNLLKSLIASLNATFFNTDKILEQLGKCLVQFVRRDWSNHFLRSYMWYNNNTDYILQTFFHWMRKESLDFSGEARQLKGYFSACTQPFAHTITEFGRLPVTALRSVLKANLDNTNPCGAEHWNF